MTFYFIAANVWLLLALVLFLGRTSVTTALPVYYRFMGVGGLLSATEYNLGILLCVVVAAIFFFKDSEVRARERRAERRGEPTRRG
ncbi:MAG TPA: hypothetical protein VGN26_08475 [Armatimonadota bacterium]|jgi:hypothetical protein